MPKEILLPELAESVVEGEILQWLVNEGDSIARDQAIVEVMTDKVTVELPSPYAGILTKQLVKVGDVVPVHSAIAVIDEQAVATPELAITAQEERSIVEAAHIPDKGDDLSLFKTFGEAEQIKVPSSLKRQELPSAEHGRILAVPAARQLARALGIDLSTVRGSGANGRIRLEDVTALQNVSQPVAPTAQNSNFPAPIQYKTPKGYEHLESRVPLRGMRRAIANQMQASHLYTVRTLTVDEVNMSALVGLRERLNSHSPVKVSYLPFIFKAIATALQKFPALNSSFDEASGEVVLKQYYHLGMAVATPAGLTVPVVKDVPHKSILGLAKEINELASLARDGKLTPEQLSGSTFSITNIGSIGALFSFPIINVPDSAIMGIHSIVKRPIVTPDDQIAIAHMMYLSLSFDHRLIDGAEAAMFCKEVIRLLENPDVLMLEAI